MPIIGEPVPDPVRRLLPTLLLVLPLLVAGCGGPLDRATYEQKVQVIGKDVSSAMARLEPTGGHQPTADDLQAAGKELGTAADDLDALHPPDEVAEPHRRMVKGLREMRSAFLRLADAFGKARTDEERTRVFLDWSSDKDAKTAREDIAAAQQGYQQHGYAVFSAAG